MPVIPLSAIWLCPQPISIPYEISNHRSIKTAYILTRFSCHSNLNLISNAWWMKISTMLVNTYHIEQVLISMLFWHDDVIKWKHFPRYWPFVRGIHRSPVNSPHKGQWRGPLMFTLNCVWINDWVNNREAGDLRRYRAHYDVTLMDNSLSHYLRTYLMELRRTAELWLCSVWWLYWC